MAKCDHVCPVCGSPFVDNSRNHAKRYCSMRCQQKAAYVRKYYGEDEPVSRHVRKAMCDGDCFYCEYPDCIL